MRQRSLRGVLQAGPRQAFALLEGPASIIFAAADGYF
jgi:hypothetical protein